MEEMSLDKALELAAKSKNNLVAMNNDEKPVCKIMNYGKYLYEQQKKAKMSKASKVELKEVRFNPVIAEHDLEVKAKTASRILSEGDKVKVTVQYRGRMARLVDNGIELLHSFEAMIDSPHKIDKPAKIEGNRATIVLVPTK